MALDPVLYGPVDHSRRPFRRVSYILLSVVWLVGQSVLLVYYGVLVYFEVLALKDLYGIPTDSRRTPRCRGTTVVVVATNSSFLEDVLFLRIGLKALHSATESEPCLPRPVLCRSFFRGKAGICLPLTVY